MTNFSFPISNFRLVKLEENGIIQPFQDSDSTSCLNSVLCTSASDKKSTKHKHQLRRPKDMEYLSPGNLSFNFNISAIQTPPETFPSHVSVIKRYHRQHKLELHWFERDSVAHKMRRHPQPVAKISVSKSDFHR